jgi:nucleoside-diphosphate-sugar epimerase
VVYGYGKALTMACGTGADFLSELIDKPALGQPGVAPYGDEILDWLYVEDAARAVVLATKALKNRSIGLNICGERSTIRGVATRIKHLYPEAQLEVRPAPGVDQCTLKWPSPKPRSTIARNFRWKRGYA